MRVPLYCWFGLPPTNRRSWRTRLLSLLLLALITASVGHAHASSAQPSTQPLLAIYLLALDNDLALHEQSLLTNQEVGTAGTYDRMAIVVSDGRGPHDTRVLFVQNGQSTPLDGLPNAAGIVRDDLDEYDMADGATLGGLLKWARQTYPTPQTLVTFVGHGLPAAPVADVDQLWPRPLTAAGQLLSTDNGIPLPTKYWAHPNYTDNHPKRTLLTPKQLGIALAQATDHGANPITVLDLIHCFGATMEELVEVAPYALATVGSPSYAYLQPEMLQQSLQHLPTNLGAVELAQQLATYHQIAEPNHPAVITAVDNSRLAALQDAWNGVAGALLQRWQQAPTTRDQLTQAWRQAAKYDAPLCDDEWRIDDSDYLADLGSFARALQNVFPGEPMADRAQQVLTALDAAVTTITHADHPWMRPDQFWNFNQDYAGIALYGNLIPWQQDGQTYLSFQAHFYTSTATEVPYRFLQRRTPNDTTWADLFTTFWQGHAVQTVACLPALQMTSGSNADLGLLIDLPTTPVTIVDQLVYTMTVHNIGAQPASAVTVYPTLPTSVTLLTLDPQCQAINGALTCPLGVLQPGTKAAVTLTVKPNGVGRLELQAEVTGQTPENGLSNNWATAPLVVQPSAAGCVVRSWDASTVYLANTQASHQDHLWQAKWWTQGEEPGTTGEWGVWLDRGPCNTQSPSADQTPPLIDPTPHAPVAKLFLPFVIR